jgi:hypothetical protein
MKFASLFLRTLSLTATLGLAACGGGGDTGPTWAQDLKTNAQQGLLEGDATVRVYQSTECKEDFFPGLGYLQQFQYLQSSNPRQLLRRETYFFYEDSTCAGTVSFTLSFPDALISIDGGTTLATGEKVQQVTISIPNGQATLTPQGDAELTANGTAIITNSGIFQVPTYPGAVLPNILYFSPDMSTHQLGDEAQSLAQQYPNALSPMRYELKATRIGGFQSGGLE